MFTRQSHIFKWPIVMQPMWTRPFCAVLYAKWCLVFGFAVCNVSAFVIDLNQHCMTINIPFVWYYRNGKKREPNYHQHKTCAIRLLSCVSGWIRLVELHFWRVCFHGSWFYAHCTYEHTPISYTLYHILDNNAFALDIITLLFQYHNTQNCNRIQMHGK